MFRGLNQAARAIMVEAPPSNEEAGLFLDGISVGYLRLAAAGFSVFR